MPTANATPEQHRWLHTHFERSRRGTRPQWRGAPTPRRNGDSTGERGTPNTRPSPSRCWPNTAAPRRRPPPTRSNTDAPKYRTGRRSSGPHSTRRQRTCSSMCTADTGPRGEQRLCPHEPRVTEIIRQGVGVYAIRRLLPDANTPWATTERGAHIHAYQPTTPCRLPHPDDHNTVIFTDACGTTSLTPAAAGAALELKADTTGRLHQHHLTGGTIFGASSRGELKTLAIVVDAVNDTHQEPRHHTHHVWVVVDAAVDFQIVRRLARQPLHKATDSSLGTQALHLWTALRHLLKHVVLHFVKQESHRYSLGNGHIDLHAHNQLAEHMPDGEDPPLHHHMHTHLQHLPPVPRPGEPPAWVPDDRIYNDTGRAYHYPQPIRTMAHIRGGRADNALLKRLQHELRTALYF